MNFKTYEDLTKCLVKNMHKIPRDIDLIVGIPRSGTMVASILALYLNLPFTDIDNFVECGKLRTGTTRKCNRWIKTIDEAQKVLVVDDSISSGKAIKEAKELIRKRNVRSNIVYMAVYALRISKNMVDIYLEICEQPRMFEWNYMHHWALQYCCMDIDGVICGDPRRMQNDDGEKYREFLKNAAPKFIPTQKVGKFVSTRLEKYRAETEEWMRQYDIQYDELVMLDGITAKERALLGKHAEYKAEVYKKCNAILFFESSYEQALEICKISGKPVFCIENRTLITSNDVWQKMKVNNKEFSVTLRRVIQKILRKINYAK